MFHIPDLAIGTILASGVAGLVSLLSLIISKEQKISDFRQDWINSLRSDVTSYLTKINSIHDALKLEFADYKEKLETLGPLYGDLNSSYYNIVFKINPKESRPKELLSNMNKIWSLLDDDALMIRSNIKPIEVEIINSAQKLLKYEWARVKTGEITYKIAKMTALMIVIIIFILVVYYILVQMRDPVGNIIGAGSASHLLQWLN